MMQAFWPRKPRQFGRKLVEKRDGSGRLRQGLVCSVESKIGQIVYFFPTSRILLVKVASHRGILLEQYCLETGG